MPRFLHLGCQGSEARSARTDDRGPRDDVDAVPVQDVPELLHSRTGSVSARAEARKMEVGTCSGSGAIADREEPESLQMSPTHLRPSAGRFWRRTLCPLVMLLRTTTCRVPGCSYSSRRAPPSGRNSRSIGGSGVRYSDCGAPRSILVPHVDGSTTDSLPENQLVRVVTDGHHRSRDLVEQTRGCSAAVRCAGRDLRRVVGRVASRDVSAPTRTGGPGGAVHGFAGNHRRILASGDCSAGAGGAVGASLHAATAIASSSETCARMKPPSRVGRTSRGKRTAADQLGCHFSSVKPLARPRCPIPREPESGSLKPTLGGIMLRLRYFAALALAAPLVAQTPDRHTLSGTRVAIYDLVGDVRIVEGTGREWRRGDAPGLRRESAAHRNWRDGSVQTLRVIFPFDRVRYGDRNHGHSTRTSACVTTERSARAQADGGSSCRLARERTPRRLVIRVPSGTRST